MSSNVAKRGSAGDIFKQLSFGLSFGKSKKRNVQGQNTGVKRVKIEEIVKGNETQNVVDEAEDNEFEDSLHIMTNQMSQAKPTLSKKKKRTNMKSKEETEKDMQLETVNRIRNELRLNVKGEDVPAVCLHFEDMISELNIPKRLVENVVQRGMCSPTPIQAQSITVMMQKRNILAAAPTGSGKTLAFVIPLIASILNHEHLDKDEIVGIILAPTRELAKQIHEEIVAISEGLQISCCLLSNKVENASPANIVVSTPNRLIHSLKVLNLDRVQHLIVDESDRLFQAGETGFRDQLAKIYVHCNGDSVRRAFFSATHSHEVEQWCSDNLDNLVMVTVGIRNRAISSVTQSLVYTGDESGKVVTLRQMMAKGEISPPVLVFLQSIDRVKQLAQQLKEHSKWKLDAIHANLDQHERDLAVSRFHRGDSYILLCTELMARGIDFKGVNVVINFDMPTSPVSYIHRIGRTGRAGATGVAMTFFTDKDRPMLRNIANCVKDAGCPIPDFMLKLHKAKRGTRKMLKESAPRRKDIISKKHHKPSKKIRREKKTPAQVDVDE